MEGAILAERTRQHREMRLKGNAELKDKVEELKVKLQTERERMQKDFEGQVSVSMQHNMQWHRRTVDARRTAAARLQVIGDITHGLDFT